MYWFMERLGGYSFKLFLLKRSDLYLEIMFILAWILMLKIWKGYEQISCHYSAILQNHFVAKVTLNKDLKQGETASLAVSNKIHLPFKITN